MIKKAKKVYGISKSGREITDDVIDEIVDKFESGGYDEEIRRRGRPRMGKEAAVVFQVRLEPELHLALMDCAEAAGVTPSEMARRILRSKLKTA